MTALNSPGIGDPFQLIKELIGSAMYFANIHEYKSLVEDKVQKQTCWDRVHIIEFDPDKKSFVDYSPEGIADKPTRIFYSFESPFIRQMISSTGYYRKELTEESPENFEKKLAKDGYSSLCICPVLPREHFAGVVMGIVQDSSQVTTSDCRILELTAEVVALATQIFRSNRQNSHLNQKVLDYHDQMIRLESLKIMGELTAGAAGDLNNILAGVIGSLQLMEDRIEDQEIRDIIRAVQESARAGKETVRNLQEFKKVDTQQDHQVIPLKELVERAVQLTHSKWLDEAMARSVEYRIETDIPVEMNVSGNPTALLVAIILIIFKQIEGIPDGGKITIEAVPVQGMIHMAFRADLAQGPEGILADLDPFIHRSEGSQFSLNLSAAREILRRHNGGFAQESVIGTGTRIRIQLPLHSLDDRTDSDRNNIPPVSCPRARGARILVVEDEPVVRQLLEDMLEVEGFLVESAENGPAGLDMITKASYDLIITDLGMPVMSGLDFTLRVRHILPDIPIIMATGWESRLDRKKLKEYKINHVVGKPFQFRKLIESIIRLLCKES